MSILYTKPTDDKDYISVSLKEEGVTIWIDIESWFDPYLIYSEESIENLVPELKEFILRWRENAEKAKETFVPSCPEKMRDPNLSIMINSIRSPECRESVTSYMQRYHWIWREN